MTPAGSRVKNHFESQAARYEDVLSSGPLRWYRRREAAELFEMLGPCAGADVLELGSGNGFYTRQLITRGARRVTAVDFSPAMLAQLDDPAVAAVCGDAAEVALGREFPLVLSAGLLEFVPEPRAVLANVSRHLAPGGRAALLVPRLSFGGWLYRLYHRSNGLRIGLFTPGDLATLAVSCGLNLAASRFVRPFTLVVRLEKPVC